MKFIETICQSISVTKQFLEKNIDLSMSHKDRIINEKENEIEELHQAIEDLKARLIDED